MSNIFDYCKKSEDGKHQFVSHATPSAHNGWQSYFMCERCHTDRTASEKFQLDSLNQQTIFLKKANQKLFVMMISVIIAMLAVISSTYFGYKPYSSQKENLDIISPEQVS